MKKLIKLSDFIMERFFKPVAPENALSQMTEQFKSTGKYAAFLQQPVKLEMFVPCWETGKPMPTPADFKEGLNDSMTGALAYKNFIEIDLKAAQEKILFKNCYMWDVDWVSNGDLLFCWIGRFENQTIEELIKFQLELTANALEQLTFKIPEYECN